MTDFTLAEFQSVVDSSLVTTFLACNAFVPGMKGTGYGRIINLSSIMSHVSLPNRTAYTERIARALGLYYHGKLPADRVYTLHSARELLERHDFEIRELRRAHMLPLVLGGPSRLVWWLSCALERIPGLNVVATTIEGVATSHR